MGIGFFDSGVGGFTVLKEALQEIKGESFLYYADTGNVPYGTKTKEEVKGLVIKAADFLAARGIKALVVACNTATSIAIGDLRKRYSFPVIGMEPAVKPAVERTRDKKVLVLATPLTLREEKYHNLVARLDAENIVDSLPLPGLVEFAENFVFSREIVLPYLRDKLFHFNMEQYGTVVLGCTHFPFFRRYLREILPPEVSIIDGNAGTVRHLVEVMRERGMLSHGLYESRVEFFTTGKEILDRERFDRYMEILK